MTERGYQMKKWSKWLALGLALTLSLGDGIGALAQDTLPEDSEAIVYETAEPGAATAEQRAGAQNAILEGWRAGKTTVDISAYNIPTDEIEQLYFDLLDAHPEIDYVKRTNDVNYIPSNGYAIMVFVNYTEGSNGGDQGNTQKEQAYNQALADFRNSASSNFSELEKALYVNEFICRTCQDDSIDSKNSVYNVLVDHKATYKAYASAYVTLARELGLECQLVKGGSAYYWAMVKVNGKYYFVDPGYDDPTPDMKGRARHAFFLKSSAGLRASLTDGDPKYSASSWTIGGDWKEEWANDTTYDNYFWNNIDCGMEYMDGYWYAIDNYRYLRVYTYDGTGLTEARSSLLQLPNEWKNISTKKSYWKGAHSGLYGANGMLYYNSGAGLYRYEVATGKNTLMLGLVEEEKSQGAIYGMTMDKNGIITYDFGTAPDAEIKQSNTFDACSFVEDTNPKTLVSVSISIGSNTSEEVQAAMNAVTSGNPTVEYRWWYEVGDGEEVVIQSWTRTNTITLNRVDIKNKYSPENEYSFVLHGEARINGDNSTIKEAYSSGTYGSGRVDSGDLKNLEITVSDNSRYNISAYMSVEISGGGQVEYAWYVADSNGQYYEIQSWSQSRSLKWIPDKFGDYNIKGKVRLVGNNAFTLEKDFVAGYHPYIKGKCQMPYGALVAGGTGYLIGVETYDNPDQSYRYEMLIMDCTLLAQGLPAWTFTTGQFCVDQGNAGWVVWDPLYGYYWTLFRVYDAQGNLIDEECYGFENIC